MPKQGLSNICVFSVSHITVFLCLGRLDSSPPCLEAILNNKINWEKKPTQKLWQIWNLNRPQKGYEYRMRAETEGRDVTLFDLSWECSHWAVQFLCYSVHVCALQWNSHKHWYLAYKYILTHQGIYKYGICELSSCLHKLSISVLLDWTHFMKHYTVFHSKWLMLPSLSVMVFVQKTKLYTYVCCWLSVITLLNDLSRDRPLGQIVHCVCNIQALPSTVVQKYCLLRSIAILSKRFKNFSISQGSRIRKYIIPRVFLLPTQEQY